MLAEFSINPADGIHRSQELASVIRALEDSGIDYRLGPMGTSVQGDCEEVMAAIIHCHQMVADKHARVIVAVQIAVTFVTGNGVYPKCETTIGRNRPICPLRPRLNENNLTTNFFSSVSAIRDRTRVSRREILF